MPVPTRILSAALVAIAACDNPPKPEADPVASMALPPPEMPTLEALAPALPGRRNEPVLSAATMKRQRAELCYFGGLGVAYAREAYWESLDNEVPSADHIPKFGEYDEHKARTPGREAPLAAKMGRLPFERHLRTCAAAKAQARDEWPELDVALAAFEPAATRAAGVLTGAARYYARREYDRDRFERGRADHEKISDELGSAFDAAHAAYGAALVKWLPTLGPVAEDAKRDEAGKLASRIIVEARALTVQLLDARRDDKAVGEHLARLEQLDFKGAPDTAHGRAMAQPLASFLATALAVRKLDKPGARDRYLIGARFADLLEADSRGLIRLISGDDPTRQQVPRAR